MNHLQQHTAAGNYSEAAFLAAAERCAIEDERVLAAEERATYLVTLDDVEGEVASLDDKARNILFQFIARGESAAVGDIICAVYDKLIREKGDAVLRGDVQ